jgi:Zn-dependent metalloprotease
VFFVLTKTKWSLTGLLLIASSLSWSIERESARGIDLNSSSVNQGRTFSAGSQLHQKFGLSSGNTLIQKSERIDQAGKTHKRYQQYYKGVPIWGDTLTVHSNPAGKLKASGFLIKGLERTNISDAVDNGPSITADQAITSVQAQLKHSSADWVISAESIKAIIYIENQKVTLAYLIEYLAEPANTQIPFRSSNALKPSRPFFILDANTGKTLKKWEGLNHVKIGTGPGGNEKIGRYEYGNDFAFLDVQENADTCTLENDNVKTVNLNNGTSGSTAYSYTCPENTFQTINGAYSPLNDAHYFGNVVFNMYQDWLNTSPLSFQLIMRVHYDTNYDNAFWDGQAMSFGDGASMFYPLVDINVSAHEVSHGFTEQNSGLVYSNESGGMNEAFSDIAGEAAEFYLRGHVDWLVGADITKNMTALRYFENPTLDGISIGHTDDYSNGMDVHNSSGIYNRAFYLLANSANWDVQTAFITFAHANMNYWTANETFINGACGVIDSAYDLNYDFLKVDTAFKAVGIDCGTLPFYDMDGDGMDDNWEISYGLDNTDPSDAALDNDSDALSNLQEFTFNTNPLLADTDDDGLSDYQEVMTHNTNPNLSDSDGDGLTDGYEVNTSSTNPNNVDSDNDGLNDNTEIEIGTNANNADSDGDGMSDGWEIESGLDPLTDDAVLDPDNDGLSNAQEAELGTNPNNSDTDSDNLSDSAEVNIHNTNPLNSDTDADEMPDGWEIQYGLDALTDNAAEDYDGDGFSNLDEFNYSTDPSDPSSIPPFALYGFESGELPENWVTSEGSNAGWQIDDSTAADGNISIRAETISHSQNARIEFSDYFSEGQLSFMAKISTENCCDYLAVYVDSIRVFQLAGERDWQEYSFAINEGLHTIRMEYHKDGSVNTGSDTVWIDDIMYVRQDADRDGMPDVWENLYSLDMHDAGDAALDNDSDALSNLQEFTFNTNPLLADTDDDGLSDYQEVMTHNTNPNLSDSDGDGLTDGYEVNTSSTNPNNVDSDNDGLNDNTEIEIGTNANNADSDGDGMSDGWEIESGLDPLTDDAVLDPDNDGLSNAQEAELGTNPNNSDTDSDNLSDSAEVNIHNTNPLNSDTDADEMPDGWEIQYGLDALTDNAAEDYDGDGFSNLDEFNYSTDPSDPSSIPPFALYGFESGELPENWVTSEGSNAGWQIDDSTAADGNISIRAETISHSQNARIEFSDYFSEGQLSFMAKISTENCCDYLAVYVDSIRVFQLAGERDWQEYSFAINEGLHTIRMEYHKDGSVNTGSDTVWIDDIMYVRQDADRDGMPDVWENLYSLDMHDAGDAALDNDSDALSNLQEFTFNTNPLLADTDDDGLSDSQEVLTLNSNPNSTDTDSDGLPDAWEFEYGLLILLNDDQNDFDLDGQSNINEFNLGTNPSNPDSDGDGMYDGWEVNNQLDPLNPADSQLDADDDGLNNLAEYRLGTNINSSDTDFDGVTDSREINEINTNPLVSDSDSDGVNDAEDYYPNDPNRADKEDESNSLGGGPINPYLLLSLLLIICSRFRKS